MWKKRVCALVVFAMLVNLAFTALPVFGFSDTQNHWAADAIDRFSDKGYISGLEDGSFLPDKAVTRAEFAQIIMKVQGGSAPGGPSPFSDVSQGDWYCGAVLWAYENAFVNGYDSGFYPNDFITRQDAAVILGRVYTMMSAQMSVIEGFSDYGEIADYSKAYFVRLVGNGFLKGYDDNTVRPRASITRAEAVTIIDRILHKQDESNSYIKDVTYPEKTKSPSGSIGGSGGSGSSGSGSGSKPTAAPDSEKPVLSGGKYQIKTAKNLVWLLSRANRSQVSAMMDDDFVLTADIDLSGYYFTSPQDAGKIPGGKTYVSFSPLSGFTGSFDGGMHKITGFTLYLPKTDGAAMFLENRGEIKNLLLLKANVTGQNNSAILASQNSGEIDNVRVTGSLSGADCAGGVAAVCDGKISRVSADVALSAQSKAGAICGQGKNIKTCIAQGTVTVQGENAGGIVGVATGDIGYNISKLSGIAGDNNIGGIAGLANGLLSFNLCQSSVISAVQQTPSVHAVCGLQSVLPQNNFTLAKTILMAAGNPVAYAPVAENGTQITKEQGDSESFYAENGFYGEGGFQKSAQGLPAIDTAAITADEAQAAPSFVDGSLSYVGEGLGEKKAMITASLSYAGMIKWASCPAGTQNPELVFLEGDEILRTGGADPFEITLSAAEASDVYLKAVSVDGIEGNEVLCIPNVMPQMFASGKGTAKSPMSLPQPASLGALAML